MALMEGYRRTMRNLLLLRHADAESTRPGGTDRQRRLTDIGRHQARSLGEYLSSAGIVPDQVLCSPAERAEQTLTGLAVQAPVTRDEGLYEGGGERLLSLIRGVKASIGCLLVVGHAPTVPWVVQELADPDTSDATALNTIEWRYPPCTLAQLEVDDDWQDVERARLRAVQLPSLG